MNGSADVIAQARELFRSQWVTEPSVIASAPGRVNLIGEHTDYNDGFVFPVAINRRTAVAIGVSPDGYSALVSSSQSGTTVVASPPWSVQAAGTWVNYPLGVAAQFAALSAQVPPFRAAVASNVPVGAGLSSSAALEAATACCLSALLGTELDKPSLAALCQRAEHEFAGVRCGIMDQMASIVGQAIVLDCRTREFERIALPPEVALVILDSGIPRGLTGSLYNERRSQCEEGVHLIARSNPNVTALRDVNSEMLVRARSLLSDTVFRRCRHVVTENDRVLKTAAAIKRLDMGAIGELLADSHASMRDDYEISLPAIDRLAQIACGTTGCYGARLTGAGFGGAVIALVDSEAVNAFAATAIDQYRAETNKPGSVLHVLSDEGVRLEQTR